MKKTAVEKMLRIATRAHRSQKDKLGVDYIEHPKKVMAILAIQMHRDGYEIDSDLCCIALGHDLLEDTPVTSGFLRRNGMSERAISGIQGMTKPKGMPYDEYIESLASNIDTLLVKRADASHNSDPSRLNQVPEPARSRLERKYGGIIDKIDGMIDLADKSVLNRSGFSAINSMIDSMDKGQEDRDAFLLSQFSVVYKIMTDEMEADMPMNMRS